MCSVLHVATLFLYHPHCARGDAHICPEYPEGNMSFRRCQNRWDNNIKMELKIQHFRVENFFKLLSDINIITTLYISGTVFLNVVLVRYIYTWGWLVPTSLNGIISTMKVI